MEDLVRTSSLLLSVAIVLACVQAPEEAKAQEGRKVIQIVAIDTGGDLPKFLEFSKRIQVIADKTGSTGQRRIWQSTLAGPETGSVAVAIEYPSLISMAESTAKTAAAPEWQQLAADFQAAGMRVVSNSIAVEITP